MSADLLLTVLQSPKPPSSLTTAQWEVLLAQARQSRLSARLAAKFQDKNWLADVSYGPRVQLESALRLADRQQHEVMWEADCLKRALGGLGVPVVLLKGAAYLVAQLPAAKGRLFADIDILVPQTSIATVESALFAAGWLSDERDAYNQRYYREWMHEIPPLRHIERNSYIDLHHTITPPTSRFKVNGASLLERIVPLSGHPGLFVLSPSDMVLHSAVHLFSEGEFKHGVRDLFDLADLLTHFEAQEPLFWPQLLDRAEMLGLQVPLFHTLFHLHRLIGKSAPERLQSRITGFAPNALARHAMAWCLGHALRPYHPTCDTRWTALARWLLYVRSHAIRMPLRLVVPHLVRKAWMRRFPERAPDAPA